MHGPLPGKLGIVVLVERMGGWLNYINAPTWLVQRYEMLMEAEGLYRGSLE